MSNDYLIFKVHFEIKKKLSQNFVIFFSNLKFFNYIFWYFLMYYIAINNLIYVFIETATVS